MAQLRVEEQDRPDEIQALAAGIEQYLFGGLKDSLDIIKTSRLISGFESAKYYIDCMNQARMFNNLGSLYDYALTLRSIQGLVLEFGVASGRTLTRIANSVAPDPAYGFDSFQGLPEPWKFGRGVQAFKREDLPEVPSNAELVIGYFNDTLADFVKKHRDAVSLLHVDCDLYSSTKTIFDCLGELIAPGCVIIFNEYFNYPGWKHHEYKAFQEFVAKYKVEYDYVAVNRQHQQVAVVIRSNPGCKVKARPLERAEA